jgi:hypothetical protein
VAEFLTPEWVAELDAAARDAPDLRALGRDEPLTVEMRIRGGAGDEFVFHAEFSADGTRFSLGSRAEPDLVLALDAEFARAIRSGDANIQDALHAGALKVEGDVEGLAGRAPALAKVGNIFAVRRDERPGAS